MKKKGKDKIPATLRNVVWNNHAGSNTTSYCYCCGVEQISKANFAVGHITSEATGGLVTASNLRPVCTLCNSSMGKTNMHQFMLQYGLQGIPERKYWKNFSSNYCTIL